LGKNQSEHGHIPSLIHDPEDRGASDTTPLFLMALAFYRRVTGETDFLEKAAQKSLTWMIYQSPDDNLMVGQLPTSDWRDEQWILGYGLFVNAIVYTYLIEFGFKEEASRVRELMSRFIVKGEHQSRHVHEGLVISHKPYYAAWSYKVYKSERFDLLGNCLAILTGIASPSRARAIIHWIEKECERLRMHSELYGELPPCLIPYIHPKDPDWRPRDEKYNRPGEYHNGGIWPFICGFYLVALQAAGFSKLAEKKLEALTEMVRLSKNPKLAFGFNEWIKAQDWSAQGQDWQTWSAAMFLYAVACIEKGEVLFFNRESLVEEESK
jgi:hypothetical protein